MSYYYRMVRDGFHVYLHTGKIIDHLLSDHATEHAARAEVSFLNGGLHPELSDRLYELVVAVIQKV